MRYGIIILLALFTMSATAEMACTDPGTCAALSCPTNYSCYAQCAAAFNACAGAQQSTYANPNIFSGILGAPTVDPNAGYLQAVQAGQQQTEQELLQLVVQAYQNQQNQQQQQQLLLLLLLGNNN
jgi:hypothetical protein